MGDSISDQELRRRLASYNVVVPPVTDSTRKLLIKKLTKLESGDGTHNVASKIMPPPKLVNSTNGTNESIMISSSANANKPSQHIIFTDTDSPRKSARRRRQLKDPFDTSDSEVDAGTIGHSVLTKNLYRASSSPKSNETSLMNVSNWKNKTGEDSYVSPGKFNVYFSF
jgi:membrane protein Man1